MSNILIFLDMAVKHVHLYPYRGFSYQRSELQKVKTWNRSLDFIMLIINRIKNTKLLIPTFGIIRPL